MKKLLKNVSDDDQLTFSEVEIKLSDRVFSGCNPIGKDHPSLIHKILVKCAAAPTSLPFSWVVE